MNFNTNHHKMDFTLSKMRVVGKYNVSGQILLLPISGAGDAEFKFGWYSFSFSLLLFQVSGNLEVAFGVPFFDGITLFWGDLYGFACPRIAKLKELIVKLYCSVGRHPE